MELTLAAAGYGVDTAASGEEGLTFAGLCEPDAVICDLQMPGLTGLDVVRALRIRQPLIPVIILTESLAVSDAVEGMKCGAFGYLTKGCSAESISEELRKAIAHRRIVERNETLEGEKQQLQARIERRTAELLTANEALKKQMLERAQVELQLRLAQKLESVGRLASGIAHEINTPVQFVGDSVHFLDEATQTLVALIEKLRLAPAPQAVEDADLPYLVENIPKAFARCIDGLDRVTTIVRSMKEFAHPDSSEASPVDLNRAIESTLTIARNEYRYVADLETNFGDLPLVLCHAGDINQAILNIVVNAAHAIADVVKESGERGKIWVTTRRDGMEALITIGDTGAGIPAGIQEHIFDPFFTTKTVGRGTGQGLAIARAVIVGKHQGHLSFESEVGKGTTFFIRLPISGVELAAA